MNESEIRAINCRLGFLDQRIQVTLMRMAEGEDDLDSYLNFLLSQRQQAEALLQSAS